MGHFYSRELFKYDLIKSVLWINNIQVFSIIQYTCLAGYHTKPKYPILKGRESIILSTFKYNIPNTFKLAFLSIFHKLKTNLLCTVDYVLHAVNSVDILTVNKNMQWYTLTDIKYNIFKQPIIKYILNWLVFIIFIIPLVHFC